MTIDDKSSPPTVLTILHFNDCYNVDPRELEPSGGAARMVTAFNAHRQQCNPLILFSGDIMAPSIMSTFTKGDQMIPVLRSLAVDCALFGNHDFDFGIEHLKSFATRTAIPWLMSNVFDPQTDRPLADGLISHIVHKNDKKIGIIGLVEEQWVTDLIDDPFTYKDFISEGRKLAKHLKETENVDFVIALTHMRWHNDYRLAENVDEIDLILGGHDHDHKITCVANKWCIKSGTDFRQFSKIDVEFTSDDNHQQKYQIKCREIRVNSYDFTEDPDLKAKLRKYSTIVDKQLDTELGVINESLDARFSAIRCRETNLGNFICDIVLVTTGADAVVLNSGTFRSDQIHPSGSFKMADLVRILPMMDGLVVLTVTGRQLWQTLECAVAHWPILDGSFAQVSRINYAFTPNRPVGCRVDPKCVLIGGQPLDLDKSYRLVTKDFLFKGKDGYSVLKECEPLVTEEICTNLFDLVKKYFESVANLTTDSESNTQSLVCSVSHPMASPNPSHDLIASEYQLRKYEPKLDGRITVLIDNSV